MLIEDIKVEKDHFIRFDCLGTTGILLKNL